MNESTRENKPPAPEEQERIKSEAAWVSLLRQEIGKVIVGQKYLVDRLIVGLLANGHVLLEGVPGLAKTLAVKTLADCIQADFKRIQFTPDLLPADVIGTMIFNMKENDFSIKKGPIFANFVLADEINRAPAKVQSALLEAMQERQVTIGDSTFQLKKPFLVMATQNPVEQEGTYPLPEAQVDRFMLKVIVDYPSIEDEKRIMQNNLKKNNGKLSSVVNISQISKAQEIINEIYIDDKIQKYILDLIFASRYPDKYKLEKIKPMISFGASPRGSINLALAAKCNAFINHRGYVIPEDVREVVFDVLRHRIGLTYEAEAENITSEDLIEQIINQVEVP